MPEVVDRRALRVNAGLERIDHGVAKLRNLRPLQCADRTKRVDARAEERLVGVDVAHSRDPLLGQEEGLDRLLAPRRLRAQRLGGEVGTERLWSEARCEVVI